tara:strand:- start:887 stop:1645 length:759 start_codon:yes stop_codon:yes gene_type:complete
MANPEYILGLVLSVFLVIVLVVIVLMTMKRIYNPTQVGTMLIDKPVEMTTDMTTCSGKLSTSGSEHAYSFWFFVNQWETGSQKKHMFTRTHNSNKIVVELDSNHPDMTIRIVDNNNNVVVGSSRSSGTSNDGIFSLKNVRIQGWNHITICVWDRLLEVYMNGKLARTFLLPVNLLSNENNGILIGGTSTQPTFSGFMARFVYFPRVLSPREIYNIYLKGPSKTKYLSSEPGTQLGTEIVFGGNNSPECSSAN